MTKKIFIIILGLLFWTVSPLLAQVVPPVPIELEGPISAIVDNGDGTGSITVMDITVAIPSTAVINTPTRQITITQLADPTPLVGRGNRPGFLGGTAIIIGTSDGVTNTADDIFAEPAENVILGLVTAADCNTAANPAICNNNSIEVLGIRTRRLTNRNTADRLPANPPTNEFGFRLHLGNTQLAGELVDAGVALEGYYPPNKVNTRFNWFVFELAGAGQVLNFDRSEVSVLRAQCRVGVDGIQLDVMGSVHRAGTGFPAQAFPDPSIGSVAISIPGGDVFGTAGVVAALDEITGLPNGFGTYDFALAGQAQFTVCPTEIRAAYRIPGEQNSATVFPVAVR